MIRPAALLTLVALIEGATGVALMWAPGMVVRLLFASDLDGTALIVARIAGMELFGFALACWIAGRTGEPKAIVVGMFAYNLLVGAYFVFIGMEAAEVGPLLWPAAAFHVAFAALLAGALRSHILENRK